MTWAEIPAAVRERCWADIKQRIDERADGPQDAVDTPDVNCDRYLYSRRLEPCRLTVERRVVSAQPRNFRPQSLAWAFR